MAIVNRSETGGRWRLAPAGMMKEAGLLQFNSVPDAGEQVMARGHDDHPNAGNLIGYFLSQARRLQILAGLVRARAETDPNHALTSVFRLWQIEQGNRDQTYENAERPGVAARLFFFF